MDRLLRLVLAGLLLAAATVFAIGVAVERNQGDEHTDSRGAGEEGEEGGEEGDTHTEGGEEGDTHAEGGEEPSAGEAGEASEESEELFGIDTESTPVVAAFVAASALLALAVLASRAFAVLLIVALFGFAAMAFDVREIVHQIDESREAVVALASVTAGLHLLVGLVAVASALARPARAA